MFVADSTAHFKFFFSWLMGPKIIPTSFKIAPRSFLGTRLAAGVCQKWLGKPRGDQKRDLEGWSHLGHQGEGEESGGRVAAGTPGRGRGGVVTLRKSVALSLLLTQISKAWLGEEVISWGSENGSARTVHNSAKRLWLDYNAFF